VLIQQYQRFSLATFKARQTITEATSFLTSSSSIHINIERLLPQLIPELPFAQHIIAYHLLDLQLDFVL
jgi:hypothetical protein